MSPVKLKTEIRGSVYNQLGKVDERDRVVLSASDVPGEERWMEVGAMKLSEYHVGLTNVHACSK